VKKAQIDALQKKAQIDALQKKAHNKQGHK
jgi:hypothetical protein